MAALRRIPVVVQFQKRYPSGAKALGVFAELMYGLKRLRKEAEFAAQSQEQTSGAEAHVIIQVFSARDPEGTPPCPLTELAR